MRSHRVGVLNLKRSVQRRGQIRPFTTEFNVKTMTGPTIDLTEDSDATASVDEDLEKAIALSLQGTQESTSPNSLGKKGMNAAKAAMNGNSILSSLGGDRKQMEQERLARLKRKRGESVSPPALKRPEKSFQTSSSSAPVEKSHSVLGQAEPSLTTSVNPSPPNSIHPSTTQPLSTSGPQYPNGIVKKTWGFGYPRQGNDIKIEEVLLPQQLQAAVLSSFQWDFDWLLPKLQTTKTKFVLVMQGKGWEKESRQKEFEGIPNVRLCFPSMDGIVNCMHSKLMLLFYEGWMRIVVPTANLTSYDWGEMGGFMENMVFLIDLPKLQLGQNCEVVQEQESASDIEDAGRHENGGHRQKQTAFMQSLLQFVKAKGLPNDVVKRLHEYDFARTSRFRFVHTIGGIHEESNWKLTGHCGLGRAVASLSLGTEQALQISFVTSSVGSLDGEFMRSIYLAAKGDDGLSEYTLRTENPKQFPIRISPGRLVKQETGAEWREKFCFFFPSDATVRASKGWNDLKLAAGCAGTICLDKKWWTNSKFPKSNMIDCVSVRDKMLMHNKVRSGRKD